MKTQLHSLLRVIIAITLFAGNITSAQALSTNHYAESSQLSSGKWIKISTTEKGVHCIDAATLASWGFSDASQVSLYGKDGYMLPETFSESDYDDLQPIPVYTENGNLYFYASGSIKWNKAVGTKYWTHEQNYYSNVTFYFLTQDRTPLTMDTNPCETTDGTAMTTFDEYLLHEEETTCIGQTGRLYLGEDLINNNKVTLHAPGITGDNMTISVALGANATSSYTLSTTLNGSKLSPNLMVGASDSYTYLKEAKYKYSTDATETLNMTFSASGSGTLKSYYLNYIELFYTRELTMDKAQLSFRRNSIDGTHYAIDIQEHNASDIKVWDVTNANNPIQHTTTVIDDKVAFTPTGAASDCREYIAFNLNDNTLPTPQYVGDVEPQNLHGIDYIPDMVIVTTRYFVKEADRIAQIHRDMDNMKVLVCDQIAIFNEFSGGTPDATAIRRLMKMFYDRAKAGQGQAPRYLLLYGRGYYKNRDIAPSLHNEDNRLLVTYQSVSSTDQRHSYITDDYFGFLDDNSGKDISSEIMRLGIGRIPVRDIEQSQQVYRKLTTYLNQKPTNNLWKNKSCMIGLNGDNNLHIRQVNNVSVNTVEKRQKHIVVNKVYMSAYNSTDKESFIGAQDQIFRDLEEGAMIFNYMGHAGHTSLGTNLLNINHAKAMTNQYWPIFITATCDVCPFDKDENSVGEELFRTENGGSIGLFTTTRTVYTDGNEDINVELMREFFVPDAEGKFRLGDVIRRAKENLHYDSKGNVVSDPNKLKYCLIGDPALAIPLPTHDIKVESINGTETSAGSLITTPANSEVTLSGYVYDTNGEIATDFNGTLCYEVYDAATNEKSVENINAGGTIIPITENFSMRKYKLVTAGDTIINGAFTTTFRLPAECLQSNNAALISLYAYSNDGLTEAKGYSENINVKGNDTATPDTQAPIISDIWVGDESFCEGDAVSSNTTLHCVITDEESGVCNNEMSIGKSMTLWLDGKIACSDLSGYYKPTQGNNKGNIDYHMNNLSVGSHSATIRVFDNAGNSAEITTTFVVEEPTTPLYEVSVAEDPVLTHATLSVTGVVEEGMTIRYVIAESATGNEVWNVLTTATETVWNLNAKQQVAQPGEYLYYAIITIGNNNFVTPSKKLIVIGQ